MLKGPKKYEKKEQGNTKQEESRSNSHKATQNKNKTNRLNVGVQLIGLTRQLLNATIGAKELLSGKAKINKLRKSLKIYIIFIFKELKSMNI